MEETIHNRIKTRRTDLGLTADYVADQLDISRATYYRYESKDIEKIPIQALAPLAKVLRTTPEYLMGWDKPKPNHRSVNIESRIGDFIAELALRDATFYLDGEPLTIEQVNTIKLLAVHFLDTARDIISK